MHLFVLPPGEFDVHSAANADAATHLLKSMAVPIGFSDVMSDQPSDASDNGSGDASELLLPVGTRLPFVADLRGDTAVDQSNSSIQTEMKLDQDLSSVPQSTAIRTGTASAPYDESRTSTDLRFQKSDRLDSREVPARPQPRMESLAKVGSVGALLDLGANSFEGMLPSQADETTTSLQTLRKSALIHVEGEAPAKFRMDGSLAKEQPNLKTATPSMPSGQTAARETERLPGLKEDREPRRPNLIGQVAQPFMRHDTLAQLPTGQVGSDGLPGGDTKSAEPKKNDVVSPQPEAPQTNKSGAVFVQPLARASAPKGQVMFFDPSEKLEAANAKFGLANPEGNVVVRIEGANKTAVLASMPATGPPSVIQQTIVHLNQRVHGTDAQEFEVRLDPEELGKLRISVNSRDVGLVISIVAERPETLELLRKNSHELLAGLSDLDFDAANLSFSQGEMSSDAEVPSDEQRDVSSGEDESSELSPASPKILITATDRLDLKL